MRPTLMFALAASLLLLGLLGCPTPAPPAQDPPAWASHLDRASPAGAPDVPDCAPPDAPDGGTDFPTCEQARASYLESFDLAAGKDPPDITGEQYGELLNRGTYLDGCCVPPSSEVKICAAVIDGAAVGVTVTLTPHHDGIVSCLIEAIRGLSFPSHPRMDITSTRFSGS